MIRHWKSLSLLSICLLLSACVTGDGKDPTCATNADCPAQHRCVKRACKPYNSNEPPIARASVAPLSGPVGTLIELDGSGSKDPDGDALTYRWSLKTQPDGSKAKIDDIEQAKTSFTPDEQGTYTIQLVVTDERGETSNPHQIQVAIVGKKDNTGPIANAGPDAYGCLGEKVELDGSSSSDPDGDKLSYAWELKSQPDGGSAKLDDPSAAKPSFTPDKKGKHIFELKVSDGQLESIVDSVSIEVLDDCSLEPRITEITPNEGPVGQRVAVTIKGEGFSSLAVVLFKGEPLPGSDVKVLGQTELQVSLNLAGLQAQEYPIKVRNPNKKESGEALFTVKDIPVPTITAITPDTGIAGAKMDIKVEGTGFLPSTEALFQLTPMPTTYVSPTELTFKLDLTTTPTGKYSIKLQNPGGRSSQEQEFQVVELGSAPVLKVLNPPSGIVGTQVKFSVHGTGFSPGAYIKFDGQKIASNRLRRDEIQAVDPLDLSKLSEGKYKVSVVNIDGKESNVEEFTVEGKDPTPILDRILPFFIYFDEVNTLSVYGLQFRSGLSLKIGTRTISGADIRFKSATYFEAIIDTTKGGWTEGDYQAIVVNPNGKQSQPFKVTVTHRVPSISNVTPGGWTTGCDTQVDINGNNFVAKSQVQLGNRTFTTTSTTDPLQLVNDKLLRLTLKKGRLSATTHNLQVINGAKAKSSIVKFIMTSHASVPTPEIREVRPASAKAGGKASVYLYYNGSNRFWNGAIVKLNGKVQKTTCNSSSTYCYSLTAELDLAGLQPGQHDLTVTNPCGKVSKAYSFYVYPKSTPPVVFYTSPDVTYDGYTGSLYVYGRNFSQPTKLLVNGTSVSHTFYSSTSYERLQATNWKPPAGTAPITIQVEDAAGLKSNVFQIARAGSGDPFIRYTSPDYRSSSSSTYTGYIYVYGYGFDATATVLVGGTSYTPTTRSTSYLRLSSARFVGYKEYDVQVKNGNGKLSNVAKFSLGRSSGLRLTSMYRYNVLAGIDKFTKGQFYVYGSGFTRTSRVYLDGKALTTRYSSTTRLYVDQVLDFTTRTKPGLSYFHVQNGATKSNTRQFRVETGLSRLSRPRFTTFEPYAIFVGKKVTFNTYISGLSSTHAPYFHVSIEGHGIKKTYALSYVSGRWRFTVDTTGWKVGVYNVFVVNKATQERSGGTGLAVIK